MFKCIGPYSRLTATGFALALLITGITGCDDDDDTTGPNDTTPPSISDVTAVDANHIDVEFSETVRAASAEELSHYVILNPIVPSDSLLIVAAALQADKKTVSLATETQADVPYQLRVVGVEDEHGNEITTPAVRSFTGTTDPDVTEPALITSAPAANATDVPVGTTVSMTFTEPVTFSSFSSGTTVSSTSGPVLYSADTDDGVHYTVVPVNPLQSGTQYTVTMTGIQDPAGNTMPTRTWVFTTVTIANSR
jgi:Bacterial Ig-like domain